MNCRSRVKSSTPIPLLSGSNWRKRDGVRWFHGHLPWENSCPAQRSGSSSLSFLPGGRDDARHCLEVYLGGGKVLQNDKYLLSSLQILSLDIAQTDVHDLTAECTLLYEQLPFIFLALCFYSFLQLSLVGIDIAVTNPREREEVNLLLTHNFSRTCYSLSLVSSYPVKSWLRCSSLLMIRHSGGKTDSKAMPEIV